MRPLDVVIETPKGSVQKYSVEPGTSFFRLKKVLPTGMFFPYDFGFIPNTKGEDGDALDVVVISEFCSFPGCIIQCRIIGGFKAEQSNKKAKQKVIRNDRYFAIPVHSKIYQEMESMNDIPSALLKEIEDFFIDYNDIEGKTFKVLDTLSAKASFKIIQQAMEEKLK
jgi:inorganic pyrophosphatase